MAELEVKRLTMLDHYPREYRRALKNTLTQGQLEEYLKGSTPMFVVGPLMLPSFLKAMTEADCCMDQARYVTQASLLCHKLYLFEGINTPLVRASDRTDDYVDGMLVFSLSTQRRGWIHDLEASNEMELKNVQVEITLEDGNLCTIEAGAFVWTGAIHNGIIPAERKEWIVDEFLSSSWYGTITAEYGSC
ncbi:uncharacterized protein GIQ15_02684 [Arthroderma uncinatum]|uniref:uncharacterized protein n=1 Tax=Arthroderma uncinatum TaxID=74035 RepID=UPI00144ABEBF|nr:uncharacterized protein GIQ15_02684 [Arthroderma uncinatum]KAF3483360.1 hypothetical protein GIQ15_02684 [Arthroderma uncinatum]